MRVRKPDARGAVLCLLAGVLSVALVGPADAQTDHDPTSDEPTTEEIDAKRAEARAIEADIEEVGRQASIVIEEYHQAALALEEADAALLSAQEQAAAARRALEEARAGAHDRIVAMYQGRTVPDPLALFEVDDLNEVGVRLHYTAAVAAHDAALVDELTLRRADVEERLDAVASARTEVASRAGSVRAERDTVEQALAARQAALGRAQGELADLVAQEQARRLAEDERRARAELEERQARQSRPAPQAPVRSPTGSGEPSDGGPGTPDDPPVSAAPPPHPNAMIAVEEAKAQVGKPYEWGGGGPDSFDCSGLTSWAWGRAGVSLPHSSRAQYASLPKVTIAELVPGDLLFYGNPIHHVGLYIGDGRMVNAPYTGTAVRVDSIWRSDFAGAARPR